MKVIKKILLVVVYLTAIPIIILAQPYQKGTFSVSVGGEALFAEAKISQTHKTGGGASLKGEYVFGKHTSGTITSGYYYMSGKNTPSLKNENINAIPLKAGIRYYFGNFYGSGEAGAIYFGKFAAGTSFLYSLGLGDKVAIGARIIDIGLRHESWVRAGSTNSVIAFRIGYEFAVNSKPERNTKHF